MNDDDTGALVRRGLEPAGQAERALSELTTETADTLDSLRQVTDGSVSADIRTALRLLEQADTAMRETRTMLRAGITQAEQYLRELRR